MRKFVLLFLLTPAFASVHYASQTVKPSAQLAYKGAKATVKLASYPIRHPAKVAKGSAKAVKVAVTAVF